MTNLPVTVKRNDFQRAIDTVVFCLHCYKSSQHLHSDMEHPKYFAVIRERIREGDQIYAIDAAMEFKTYVVETIDREAAEVHLSVLQTQKAVPIMAEGEKYAYRWRGPRGGGHCIVDADGKVVQGDFNSQMSARQEIERLRIVEEVKAQEAA